MTPITPRLLASLIFVLFVGSLTAGSASAYPPTHQWSKKFGSNQNSENANGLATDASGNVVMVGHQSGSADYGGGLITNAGFSDGVMAKYDANGNYLWSRRMGGSSDYDWAESVAVDGSGNIYVIGTFYGTVDFGLGGLVSAGVGAADVYVAKFSSAGAVLWNKRYGSTTNDEGNAIAVDANGNVFLTGAFSGTVNFGGSNLVASSSQDIFLVKLDTNGNHVASSRYGTASGQQAGAVACDPTGNVIFTGYFFGTASFGGAPLISAGQADIVLAKFTNNLVHVWSNRFGSTSNDRGFTCVTTWAGEVYLGGTFTGSVDFGGGALPGAGNEDIVLAKFDGNGTHLWSQGFGSAGHDRAHGVAVDQLGRPFVTGYFNGAINFGGGTLISSGSDAFVAHFEATGVHRWSGNYGTGTGDGGQSIAVSSGDVCVGGFFSNTIDFGGGVLSATPPFPLDIFLVRFSGPPENPLITSIADIPNDQGRKVKIRFDRSARDGAVASPVSEYQAYRMDAPVPSLVRDPAGLSRDDLLVDGWTFVGAVPAHGDFNYGIDVPTIADSTIAQGPYDSHFFIRAATASSTVYFDSPASFGYSLDNLAPGVPLNFVYTTGDLTWNESDAGDFDYFTVYGSNVDAFGSAVVVDYTTSPALDVNASPYAFYFVTATDFSGNEGKPARVNTLSGTGGTPAHYVLSVSNFPNPFNPRTTVSYTVPARGPVTVAIYDARGARVATLLEEQDRVAGAYSLEWNGRADTGAPASSGVYFARIEHNGATRTKKMVLLK